MVYERGYSLMHVAYTNNATLTGALLFHMFVPLPINCPYSIPSPYSQMVLDMALSAEHRGG